MKSMPRIQLCLANNANPSGHTLHAANHRRTQSSQNSQNGPQRETASQPIPVFSRPASPQFRDSIPFSAPLQAPKRKKRKCENAKRTEPNIGQLRSLIRFDPCSSEPPSAFSKEDVFPKRTQFGVAPARRLRPSNLSTYLEPRPAPLIHYWLMSAIPAARHHHHHHRASVWRVLA